MDPLFKDIIKEDKEKIQIKLDTLNLPVYFHLYKQEEKCLNLQSHIFLIISNKKKVLYFPAFSGNIISVIWWNLTGPRM